MSTSSGTTAVVNIGSWHDGTLSGGETEADAMVCEGGMITWIGSSADVSSADHSAMVDCAGAAVVPGFIDSHVHSTFGDYTPRQNTIGFLESYLHGGMTRAISASEVHVPGRPTDRVGVKALAIAAQRSYLNYRPGGVAVHGGSVILEPDLTAEDFVDLYDAGVRLAKAGFGRFNNSAGYVPIVRAARDAGLIVMCHTGGGSIAGSQDRIDADALIAMHPHIAGHVNGGPTAMSREDNERIVAESDLALQVVQAGNLKSALDVVEHVISYKQLYRLLIASDTPTGTGVIPLAILRTMAELVSLGNLTPAQAVAAATGNVSQVYGIPGGRLKVGEVADVLVIDAPVGSMVDNWQDALTIGDLPAVAVAITDGVPRFGRSRNTPPPKRNVTLSAQ